MVYGARTTFGPQAASKNRTAPVINFTKGLRERVPYTTFQCIHLKELYKYILFIYLFIKISLVEQRYKLQTCLIFNNKFFFYFSTIFPSIWFVCQGAPLATSGQILTLD
jgi:hypothetical protein